MIYFFLQVDPNTRLTAHEIIEELLPILDIHSKLEPKNSIEGGKIHLRKVGHKRSLSEEEIVVRKKSPSEKARFHYFNRPSVMSIGKKSWKFVYISSSLQFHEKFYKKLKMIISWKKFVDLIRTWLTFCRSRSCYLYNNIGFINFCRSKLDIL